MEKIDWDNLLVGEANYYQGGAGEGGGGEGEEFLDAFIDENEMVQSGDDEGYGGGYGGGWGEGYGEEKYSDDEFAEFEQEPGELQVGFSQWEQISFSAPEMGTTVGGKFAKREQVIKYQTVPKEILYLNGLRGALGKWFSDSPAKIADYVEVTKDLPRFWLKNPVALAATFYMIDQLEGVLTAKKLAFYASTTGIDKEDLLRYYRLIKK